MTETDARRRALVWLVPGLLAAVLGLVRVDRPALWADELATWGAATASWPDLWGMVREVDVVMAPYYVLMHVWVQVAGTSEVALRLPSVAATAVAAGLLAVLGTRLATPRAGLLAGVLFALLPATSRYAQEARVYAFAVCAAVLATLLLLRALDRPGTGRRLGYAGAVAWLGLAHPIGLLLLTAHGVAVLVTDRPRTAAWARSAAVGCVPALPLAVAGYAGQRGQISWVPPVDGARLAAYPGELFDSTVVGGIVIALALLAVSWRPPALLPALWALLPAVALLVASAVTPLWVPRYLLFTLPAWALLAGLTLAKASLARGLAVAGCLALLAVPAHTGLRAADGHGQGTRDLAGLLTEHGRDGDAVVYGPATGGDGRVGRDLVARYVPADRRPADVLTTAPPRTAGYQARECADAAACLGRPDRVWVVRTGRRDDPLAGIGEDKADALAGYRVERVWRPSGLTLALLVAG